MPKSAAKLRADNRWNDKTYKSTEVLMSIHDRDIIKQWCRENGYTMSGYIYEVVIKDMAERGIRLEGTATRDVSSIIEGKEADKQKV